MLFHKTNDIPIVQQRKDRRKYHENEMIYFDIEWYHYGFSFPPCLCSSIGN